MPIHFLIINGFVKKRSRIKPSERQIFFLLNFFVTRPMMKRIMIQISGRKRKRRSFKRTNIVNDCSC
jgi:hypothetical protein